MTSIGSFLRQLGRDVRSQKLRTFLTIFGIVWGTVAVSLLLAFGHGLHRQMIKSMAGLGDRIVIAWPMRTSMTFEGLGKGRAMRMMEEDIDYLVTKVELIDGISSEYSQTLIARYGERQRSVERARLGPSVWTTRRLRGPQSRGPACFHYIPCGSHKIPYRNPWTVDRCLPHPVIGVHLTKRGGLRLF